MPCVNRGPQGPPHALLTPKFVPRGSPDLPLPAPAPVLFRRAPPGLWDSGCSLPTDPPAPCTRLRLGSICRCKRRGGRRVGGLATFLQGNPPKGR